MSITTNEGLRIDKYYSVDKFGDEEAKTMTINERKGLEILYGKIGDYIVVIMYYSQSLYKFFS